MPNVTVQNLKAFVKSSLLAFILGAVAGLSSLCWVSAAHAGVIYSTGFEAPTFTAGQLIAGQDGWTSRFGSPTGTISTNLPRTGQQDLEMKFDQLPEFGFGFNVDTVRPFLDFDTAANGTRAIYVAVDARLDGPQIGIDVVEVVLSAIDPGFNGFGEIQISADGNLYIYGSRFSDFFTASVTLGEYHRLAMTIDFSSRLTHFLVDGAELAMFPFDDILQSTVFRSGSITAVTPTDTNLADPTQYAAHIDNYVVEAIPEPATWGLVVAGVVLLAAQLRERRPRTRRDLRSCAA